jgi:hypothetical protein
VTSNVAFTDGAYYYLVGQLADDPAAVKHLQSAAQHLYNRVHE